MYIHYRQTSSFRPDKRGNAGNANMPWCHHDHNSQQHISQMSVKSFNTLRPKHNGRHFPDDTFKRIFLNENVRISSKISLKFVPKGPINTIPALVQIMAWRRPGEKPLSEPMMVRLLTHICVTRPQWVNTNTGLIPGLRPANERRCCFVTTSLIGWVQA